jgi:multidrug resistance protein MdtO
MSSRDQALPAVARSGRLDAASAWFWQFLKTELAPYRGRAWLAGRTTLAATITMLLVMTFRIPYGFLGAIYTLLLSRENPAATLHSGVKTVVMSAVAMVYIIAGMMTMAADPLTRLLWIAASLFLAFYLISIIPDPFTAIGFGFPIALAISIWDDASLTVDQRTENTLWLGFSVALGAVMAVAVEYVFRRFHRITDLTLDFQSRLQAVEDFMRQIAADLPVGEHLEKEISHYSALGTSGVRRDLLNAGYPPDLNARMNVAVALLGRLVDLAADLRMVRSTRSDAHSAADRNRCARLANRIASLRLELQRHQLPRATRIANRHEPSQLPILTEMERITALIPHAFSVAKGAGELLPPMVAKVPSQLFVPDAFTSLDHLKFAARGVLAAMLAYVVYRAIDWPGLYTSLAACIITAASTIGSSRQQLYLRMGGTVLGGFIFGMGSQILVLPYLDSITGFTALFAAVTAIAAWILTATPRFSYLGAQFALIFYLVTMQEFGMETSLAVARNHAVGILLGLSCMWAVFDRLWVGDALQAMQDVFSRNLQMLAELFEQSRKDKRQEAAMRALWLRDRIIKGFNAVEAHSDAVLLEFGPSRERKLKLRNDFKRWQPTLGVLLQVQITFLQHLSEMRFPELPAKITEAQIAFENDMAIIAQTLSDDVAGKVTSAAPDVQESAAALRQEIHLHYVRSGLLIPPPLTGLVTLAQNLASIVAPLYVDIHTTFTNLSTP